MSPHVAAGLVLLLLNAASAGAVVWWATTVAVAHVDAQSDAARWATALSEAPTYDLHRPAAATPGVAVHMVGDSYLAFELGRKAERAREQEEAGVDPQAMAISAPAPAARRRRRATPRCSAAPR